ncbi:MAG: hypothetical protein A3D31_11625 [Candidatus Fluviicola riflensis]|nr:MAG: hypothetical protein CHH17_16055 [Candidatus Fluviicola riflensis]OGS77637.1 MAG: hypothetical protein A3D31_11625 [Candidatus Fluviicola riflensis]OGS84220.1 MAG: hypothetical protein A3E30_13035 [Fluviicola sp. RIFCSPHIGHO2_12_FULL_43_24]OGS84703.1 MAG: hypothetical protein A2724_08560 [Fluviicola sp. RIFCSPHIGHO2_01_FULL_43_53]
MQRHSNTFFNNTDEPFTSYANWGLGTSFQSGGFNVHFSVAETLFKESLQSKWVYSQQGSFGGVGSTYVTTKSADVALNYLGCRVGMDYVLNHAHRFNLLMGISFQSERLVSNQESNYTSTTNDPHAVEALDQFYYWNVMFRPRYYFLPHFYTELQIGLSFYYEIRITNTILSGSSDSSGGMSVHFHDEPFYAVKTRGYLCNYFANELGFCIGYRFKEKKTTSNKTPAPR